MNKVPQNESGNVKERPLIAFIKNMKLKSEQITISSAAGIIATLAGLTVLAGWQTDSEMLKTFALGGVTMKANAAISFVLAGLALILLQRKERRKNLLTARLMAGAITILGSLVILQYIFNINLGIDGLLFREAENTFGTANPGRMAPNTALNFMLLGILLFALSLPTYIRSLLNTFLLICIFTISTMGFTGYIFGLKELTGLEAYTRMPLGAVISFLILCTGIYFLMLHEKKYTALEHKLLSGVTVASILILFSSLTAVTSINSLVSANERVEQTKLLKEELANVSSEIYGFVANDRGFLLSGNENFLADWYGADSRIYQAVENILTLTQDNPQQQTSVQLLDQLAEERINFSKLLVSTYKTEGRAAAISLFSSLQGKGISDKIDALIKEMIDEEEIHLLERTEAEKDKATNTLLIILFNLFIQIILLALIFLFVKKDVAGRRKAEAALQKLNEGLEDKIKERTAAIIQSEKKYRDLVENTLVGVFSSNLMGEILFVNQAITNILEAESTEELKSMASIILYKNPEDRNSFLQLLKENKSVANFETELITRKGNTITTLISARREDETLTGMLLDITERRRAEIEAKEANARFNNLMASLNDVVWTASADGSQIIDISKSFETVHGRTVEEFKSNPKLWLEMAHPDDLAIAEASFKELLEKGKAESEYRIVRPDGTIVWLLDRKSLIYDETGKVVQMGGIAKDITLRKILERRKDKQNEILEAISKGKTLPNTLELIVKSVEEEDPSSICSILLLDEDGKHLRHGAAPNLPDFYNQTIDGLEIGEHVGSCGAAAYSKKRVIVEDVLNHPNWIPYIELAQKANLRSCWSEPILDAEGNVLGTFAIYHRAPKAPFNEEIELLKSVVHFASLAITNKRAEEKIRNINAELEIKVEERTEQLTEINEQLTATKLEAERANLAKSEFLSRMSHELRTPMNSILGFAQLMQMGELAPAHKKSVAQILKSGKHLLTLINEVLDLSRIEAGKLSISFEPVSICNLVSETLDIVQPLANSRNISSELINHFNEELFVRADNQKLRQVLLNLVNNAVKYNRDGGSVKVECSKEKGEEKEYGVRISVVDTGNGIAPEELHKLFNPFQRIGAEVSAIEGTGLGLAVAKKLIEAMHGKVGVESNVGVGSTFWIELPQAEGQIEHHERLSEKLITTEEKSAVTGTLLYIEDNLSNIQLVEQILEIHRPSIRLITEMYGKNTVKLATDYNPNLILLDLDLPDIHGSEVLKRLQEDKQTNTIPVVILSADAMSHQIEKLMNAGAKNYLTKPLDVVEFLKVVDEFLEHRENKNSNN